ncbi:hypothetical protein V512_012255 [Mesotoga sp. Brook.08.105.5.1]|nr:hypothetical protein V512_012255 [Mesotoga sp. Brook.08.105.5.1]
MIIDPNDRTWIEFHAAYKIRSWFAPLFNQDYVRLDVIE